jgi:hypothetical protein
MMNDENCMDKVTQQTIDRKRFWKSEI